MKSKLLIILGALTLGGAVFSCRTSEENYRQAYERAIAGRDSAMALENTIYGRDRRDFATTTVRLGDREIGLVGRTVGVDEPSGSLREYLKRYSVVVGRFKQPFNARDMRSRLADGGYPRAIVLKTAEPYYYVAVESTDDLARAVAAMDSAAATMNLRAPLPFILYRP